MGHMRIIGRPIANGYYIEVSVGAQFYQIYGTGIMDCVKQLREELNK